MSRKTAQGRLALAAAVVSDTGSRFGANQDSYHLDAARGLFVVADGVGGRAAGDCASSLAVRTVVAYLEDHPDEPAGDALAEAALAAHHVVRQAADRDRSLFGMGTTLVIARASRDPPSLTIAHVGDSRAYRFRSGRLERLTEDHTLFNEARRAGLLPAERRDWPPAGMLSQAVGSREPIAPEIGTLDLFVNDVILLCTDGITDKLEDEEIAAIVKRLRKPQPICRRIAEVVKQRGAPDNLTALAFTAVTGPGPGGEEEAS